MTIVAYTPKYIIRMSWISTSNTFAGAEESEIKAELIKLKVSETGTKAVLKYILSKKNEWGTGYDSTKASTIAAKYNSEYDSTMKKVAILSALAAVGVGVGVYYWYKNRE